MTGLKELLGIVNGGIKYLTLLQKTRHVRKLRKAVDYAEKFILLSKELSHEKDSLLRKNLKKKMRRAESIFFKYNQG